MLGGVVMVKDLSEPLKAYENGLKDDFKNQTENFFDELVKKQILILLQIDKLSRNINNY